MKPFRYAAAVSLSALALIGPALSSAPALPFAPAAPPTAWVMDSLKEMQTVKVGMTRAQLLKVFTEEGGLSSRTEQLYVYQKCAYFKVRVHFKPVGKDTELSYPYNYNVEDRITEISEPFLQETISN